MSTIFSRSHGGKDNKARPRAESVSAVERVKDNRRIPAVRIDGDKDVPTLVCIELSRAILTVPNVDLGKFLKTASNSRRDISCSDTTILLTASILEHIGNYEMSKNLLKQSSTLTKFYSKMGLGDAVVREMFVTMFFSLNPDFVKMIEKSIKLSVERSASMGVDIKTENRTVDALVSLTESGVINSRELVETSVEGYESDDDLNNRRGRFSIQKTPTELVAPSDSMSVVAVRHRRKASVVEGDLHEYIRRKKAGIEPEFKAVFSRSKPAYIPELKTNKNGIGFTKDSVVKPTLKTDVNNILGSFSVKSYDMRTGACTSRRPTVMDYLESEEVAESALGEVPDVDDDKDHNYVKVKQIRPIKTETFLPDSTYDRETSASTAITYKDSLEELRGRFRGL